MVLIYAKKWRNKAFYQFNLPAAMSMYGSDTKAFKLGASSSLLVTQGCNTNNCKPVFWINKKKFFSNNNFSPKYFNLHNQKYDMH